MESSGVVYPQQFDPSKLSKARPSAANAKQLHQASYDGVPFIAEIRSAVLFGIGYWNDREQKMVWIKRGDVSNVPANIKSFTINLRLTDARFGPNLDNDEYEDAIAAFRMFECYDEINKGWTLEGINSKNKHKQITADRLNDRYKSSLRGNLNEEPYYIDDQGKERERHIGIAVKCYADERQMQGDPINLSFKCYDNKKVYENYRDTLQRMPSSKHRAMTMARKRTEEMNPWDLSAGIKGHFLMQAQPTMGINDNIYASWKLVRAMVDTDSVTKYGEDSYGSACFDAMDTQ